MPVQSVQWTDLSAERREFGRAAAAELLSPGSNLAFGLIPSADFRPNLRPGSNVWGGRRLCGSPRHAPVSKMHKTELRNREIFATHQDGQSYEDLAERYALTPDTVRQIIIRERHKRAVSPKIYYQLLREDCAPPV